MQTKQKFLLSRFTFSSTKSFVGIVVCCPGGRTDSSGCRRLNPRYQSMPAILLSFHPFGNATFSFTAKSRAIFRTSLLLSSQFVWLAFKIYCIIESSCCFVKTYTKMSDRLSSNIKKAYKMAKKIAGRKENNFKKMSKNQPSDHLVR